MKVTSDDLYSRETYASIPVTTGSSVGQIQESSLNWEEHSKVPRYSGFTVEGLLKG